MIQLIIHRFNLYFILLFIFFFCEKSVFVVADRYGVLVNVLFKNVLLEDHLVTLLLF